MRYVELFIALILCVAVTFGQETGHTGIDLYKAGKHAEAVEELNRAVKAKVNERNAELWNFLGLARYACGDIGNARKAFEKAVDIEPTLAAYHANLAYMYLLQRKSATARIVFDRALSLDATNIVALVVSGMANLGEGKLTEAESDADRAIAVDAGYAEAHVLKSDVLMRRFGERIGKGSAIGDEIRILETAVAALKLGEQNCRDDGCRKTMREELDRVEPFFKFASQNPVSVSHGPAVEEPGVTPLKILKKPRPGYTDRARLSNVEGTITLAVLFAASGRVENIFVVKKLERSLDHEAVSAAKKVEFEPMKRNGVAVPMVKLLEYHFSIY